jgi:hypothetical protein
MGWNESQEDQGKEKARAPNGMLGMSPQDYMARKVELTNRDSNLLWHAMRLSLHERVQGLQARIFNRKIKDEELEAARIEHEILQKLASGELLNDFVHDLESKIELQEEEMDNLMDDTTEQGS